jgi:hypothetical protein
VGLGFKGARVSGGFVLLHCTIDNRPRNLFQNSMKNAILVGHGLDPFSCSVDSQTTETE